jgi:hypothetical protein
VDELKTGDLIAARYRKLMQESKMVVIQSAAENLFSKSTHNAHPSYNQHLNSNFVIPPSCNFFVKLAETPLNLFSVARRSHVTMDELGHQI